LLTSPAVAAQFHVRTADPASAKSTKIEEEPTVQRGYDESSVQKAASRTVWLTPNPDDWFLGDLEEYILIDAIDTTSLPRLRNRALSGMTVYTFARVGAAIPYEG
jgi:hypothetical protein